jgi:hypothetical protein
MKVGDLVVASHWGTGYIGLIISILPSLRNNQVCRVMVNGNYCVDQLARDLEIINKNT